MKTEPVVRRDMPAQFGPSLMPDLSTVPSAEVIVIPFETTADAAARLLPRHFELADVPVVTFSRIDYEGVDYLGGRGYREVVVSVAAVYRGRDGVLQAGFAPVMWVTEVGALMAGREFMGFAKLPAEMAPVSKDETRRQFQCAEYGALFLEGEASALRPLSAEALDKVRRGAAEVQTFGWKYIPGADGVPDADYPLVNLMQWDYARAWSGEGRLTLHRPDAKAAPLSARVIAALADLPVKQYRRAFVAEGRAVINRAATRRLHPAANVA